MTESMSSLRDRATGSTSENMKAAVRPTGSTDSASNSDVCAELQRTVRALQLTVPSAEMCERLMRAVEMAATRDGESMENLRLRIYDFTTALKEAGATPEAVLVTLKALVLSGTLSPTARNHPDWSGYLLREKMSTWAIEAYFKESRRQDPGPLERSAP